MPVNSGILEFIVRNKLVRDKRDISVYHSFGSSAHIISCGSAVSVPLSTVEQDDYLHFSLVRGPGIFWQGCVISLPAWVDFRLGPAGSVTVTHSANRTHLELAPGPPTWELRITRPKGHPPASPGPGGFHIVFSHSVY